jgi:hypothetical protein
MENEKLTRDEFAQKLLNEMALLVANGSPQQIQGVEEMDGGEVFGGMLLAMFSLYSKMTGDEKSDLLDFTHIMNRLAVSITIEAIAKGTEDTGLMQ